MCQRVLNMGPPTPKHITRDGSMYKVMDGESVIYQSTEWVLLRHWVFRHPDTYQVHDSINLGISKFVVKPTWGGPNNG